MDGLSVATGVAGLLSVCIQASQALSEYYTGVANAPKSIQSLQQEFTTLEHVMKQLENFLRSQTLQDNSFNKTSALCSAVGACKDQVSDILAKLKRPERGSISRAVKRLEWPFQEKDVLGMVEKLRRYIQTFHFSLTVEGCALLSKTSKDVTAALEQHVDTSRKVYEMTKDITTMCVLAKEASRTLNQIEDVLKLVSSFSDIGQELQDISSGIRRLEMGLQDETERTILDWLSPSASVQKHHDIHVRRTPGTGQWLLQDPRFLNWLGGASNDKVVLCLGAPGVGKTVLTSLVVDHLFETFPSQNIGIAYYYCDYREQSIQTSANLAASLLRQFCLQKKSLPKPVSEFYNLYKRDAGRLQADELLGVLRKVLVEFDQCFVAIDALDELDGKKHRKGFLKLLTDLGLTSTKIFVTSRPHLQDVTQTFPRASKIFVEASEVDVELFLSRMIEDDEGMQDLMDEALKKEVCSSIAQYAKGMFLLPVLQIQSILDQVTKSGVRKSLRNLSSSLDEVFQKSIQRIQKQREGLQQIAMSSLMWMIYAGRALSTEELRHALATQPGDSELDRDKLVSLKNIIESCSGLVTTDSESSTVRFVHYTFQEYLQIHKRDLFPSGESILANVCLTYGTFKSVSEAIPERSADLNCVLQEYPLLDYASHYWEIHAQAAPPEQIESLTMKFLRNRSNVCRASKIRTLALPRYAITKHSSSDSALHAAARSGLTTILSKLIQERVEASKRYTYVNTPLHEAVRYRHWEAAQILLKNGADVDMFDDDFITPLFLAASAGDMVTIDLLISYGADVNMSCHYSWTPLHKAADNGHKDTVKQLLEHGAWKDAESSKRLTALHRAAGRGHVEVVELLLDHGCLIECKTWDLWTPLHGASSSGRFSTVDVLIERGARINHQARDGRTALSVACRGGHAETVRVLLEQGANRHIKDKDGCIALHRAAKGGCMSIVHMLLNAPEELQLLQLTTLDRYDFTTYDEAISTGQFETARYLRKVRLRIEGHDSEDLTNELIMAIDGGNASEVQHLITQGFDVNQPAEDGFTPLQVALQLDRDSIALLLLENGAEIEASGPMGWKPILIAARRGNVVSTKLCLDRGANVIVHTHSNSTPLHKACQSGSVEVTKLLLETGAQLEARDKRHWRPAHEAAAGGHEAAIRLLLENNMNSETTAYEDSVQSCAAKGGHHDLVEFLRSCRKNEDYYRRPR